jgi:glycosyltransferase involved in cell wall biosynthesis
MNSSAKTMAYVLITPARDEETHIARTAQAMALQTAPPIRWVVVDDHSTDDTALAAEHCSRALPWMRLVRLTDDQTSTRNFGSKAQAFQTGANMVAQWPYRYIGNLDADITVEHDYFQRLLAEFAADPNLGVAGGIVESWTVDRYVSQDVASDSVAGAVQMFRRECFEELGGYLALAEGGIDAAAEIMARMNGWTVRTFRHLRVLEHRRTGSANARPLRAKWREGRRLHSLGYGFCFFVLRCLYRMKERPRVIGSAAMLVGYLQRALAGEPTLLPPNVVSYLRQEQRSKIRQLMRKSHVWNLRNI